MTEIKPFKAVHYNPNKVADIGKVFCPPYDIISKDQQSAYYDVHENNYVRITFGKERPNDDKDNNKYTRAKQAMDQWLHEGVLVEDEQPSIYFYKQEYRIMGQRYNRLGFISAMKIQDEKNSKIFPHENTHSAAKEDRLKLWSTLAANCSPIFVCFADKEKTVERIFIKDVSTKKPLIDMVDDDGVRHVLWRLDDPKLVQEIVSALDKEQLFIADGHHRYEVSKEYKKFRLARAGGKATGLEPYQYVMTYFTNMDSKDLQIFPIHRVIKHLPQKIDFLEEHFRIDRIKTKNELMILLAKAGQNEHAFGLYTKGGMQLLRLKNKLLIDKIVTEGSKEYRRLDATILKAFVLDRLHITSEEILYTKDLEEATRMVDQGEAEASFILNPVKMTQLKEIALKGERMPPKTTYFYPKVLSGLTVYRTS